MSAFPHRLRDLRRGGHISSAAYDDGCYYARCWADTFGRETAASLEWAERHGRGNVKEQRADFKAMTAVLLRLSRQHRDDVENLVIHGRMASWASQPDMTPSDRVTLRRVKAALDALGGTAAAGRMALAA